jgi:hypothetical protein
MKSLMKFMAALMALFVLSGVMAFGATTDLTVGGYGLPVKGSGQAYLLKAPRLDLSATAVASNDTVNLISIPAGCKVLAVQYEVVTAATNDVTFDVGDADNASGYFSNVSATNEAGLVTTEVAYTLTSSDVEYISSNTVTSADVPYVMSNTFADIVYDSDGSATMVTQTVAVAETIGTQTVVSAVSPVMSTQTVVTAVATTGYSAGKLYTEQTSIGLHFDDAPGSTGVIDVTVILVNVVP